MRRGRELVDDPVGVINQTIYNMRDAQKGREAVASGGSLGYRAIPQEEQTRRLTEGALESVGGGMGTLLARNAKHFNAPAADKAVKLAQRGATAEEIWHDVPRNWVLPNGGVLQEISDAGARIKAPWLPDMSKLRSAADEAEQAFQWAKSMRDSGQMGQPEFERYVLRRLETQNAVTTPPRQSQMNRPLSQFLDHPDLYANYPELAKIDLAVNPHTRGAFFDRDKNLISIGTKGAESPQGLLGVTVHEANHGIQSLEGLPAGGGPEMFAGLFDEKRRLRNSLVSGGGDKAPIMERIGELKQNPAYAADSEYDAYRRLLGEQLAEVSQFRANRDTDWLTQHFPGHELTAPVEKLLWRSQNTGQIYPMPLRADTLGGYGGQRRWHSASPVPEHWDDIWRDYYGSN